jgi:hypothetical protein
MQKPSTIDIDPVIYLGIELSASTWLVVSKIPTSEKTGLHRMEAGKPMRQRQCHSPADPRRCRLARFAVSRRARQHRAPATSTYAPELNSVENIWEYLRRQLAQPPRLGHL